MTHQAFEALHRSLGGDANVNTLSAEAVRRGGLAS
jgi:hypothetical protein